MYKKIMAGILAAASILSVSSFAYAEGGDAEEAETPAASDTVKYDSTTGSGQTYTVAANVSYGIVDVTLPKELKNIIINPYGAAIKTTIDTTDVVNKGAVASEVYTVQNNDDTDGIKVMATVSVTKASGVVVKDMSLDKTSVKGYDAVGATTCDAVASFNPLVDYNAIKTTVDKTGSEPVTKFASGGDKVDAAKQKKNIGIMLLGSDDASNLINKGTPHAKAAKVNFLPKGTNTGDLGKADASKAVYFTVFGEKNPELPASTEWTSKDNISLSIVIKVLPDIAD